MNIETLGLNINDVKSSIRYSNMDKESLLSYIGKVVLKLKLEEETPNFKDILIEVFSEILKNKFEDNYKIIELSTQISNGIIDELDNYTSTDNLTKEQIESLIEPFINRLAFMLEEDFKNIKSNEDKKLLSLGLVSDAVINGEISFQNKQRAESQFYLLPKNIINIIENIKFNIIKNSRNLINKVINNQKIDFWSKATLGLLVDLFGGNLISKLIYTDVVKNEQMIKKIKEEGIVHLTSNYNADKILNSNDSYIKASDLILSGGKKRSYFFAGLPSFKDITINIYSYNVMYGVRIHPTEEQIKKLTYREYNDKALAYEGNFHFTKDQIEKVYYGLKMDENGNLFYQEITELEAQNYQVDERVKRIYNGDASLKHKIMCNAYGFYYELTNYTKLLNRIKNHNFNIENLEEQKSR